jgi:hypothetical protein
MNRSKLGSFKFMISYRQAGSRDNDHDHATTRPQTMNVTVAATAAATT